MAAGEDDSIRIPVCPREHNTGELSSYGDAHSTNPIVTRRSEPFSNAPVSSENIHEQVKCKGLSSIRKSIAENVAFPHLWNDVLVTWCVVATLLDPLFCYILVVDEQKDCIGFDKKLRLTVVVLRSLIDFGYILVVFGFRTGDTAPYDTNNGRLRTIARRYLLSYFTVDILAVLPLPQVFGAFWYFFSIERKATCLQVRCHSHPYCPRNNNSSIKRLCMDDCSGKASSNDIAAFNFGIFDDAFKSGIVYSTDLIWKFSYCYWWGLQNLSSLGQGLKTSRDIWEIYFAVSLTTSGLVLFALLIGNLQTILQATIARQEEMRLKGEDIKHWMTFQKLPHDLRKKIKQYEKYKWQKTRGIDVASILLNLPRDLRRDTTRHLCFPAIKNVSMFQNADEKLLDAVCGYLKPVLYIERNFIVREGELLEEMIFITKGKLWIYSGAPDSFGSLEEGNYFGEDLLDWVLQDPHQSTVPISTKTVSAQTKVEAFVLSAKDLKSVIFRFGWLIVRELRNDPNYKDLEQWAPWAALVLQTAWGRYIKNKRKRNSQASVTSTTNIHVSRFITRALHALNPLRKRRNGRKDMPRHSNNNNLSVGSNV